MLLSPLRSPLAKSSLVLCTIRCSVLSMFPFSGCAYSSLCYHVLPQNECVPCCRTYIGAKFAYWRCACRSCSLCGPPPAVARRDARGHCSLMSPLAIQFQYMESQHKCSSLYNCTPFVATTAALDRPGAALRPQLEHVQDHSIRPDTRSTKIHLKHTSRTSIQKYNPPQPCAFTSIRSGPSRLPTHAGPASSWWNELCRPVAENDFAERSTVPLNAASPYVR
ncbi:hypothetical protein BV20DRAFT_873315 [Pilatotrama ljubarskyi]|nr:hypothetical protein BV20DRAFT_873315 [Pilatotrama ljubarskyi]